MLEFGSGAGRGPEHVIMHSYVKAEACFGYRVLFCIHTLIDKPIPMCTITVEPPNKRHVGTRHLVRLSFPN